MSNEESNDKFWRTAWRGFKTSLDLIGKVETLEKELSRQDNEITAIKLEQARILGSLDTALRWVESKQTTPAGSGR